MNTPMISVAIATYNEEENIADLIESAKLVSKEIVVVDGNSQDKTAQLAKNFGAKVISTANKAMFHINKNIAIKNCTCEWILLMDADERLSRELAQEIKETIKKNPVENGFFINRRNWFLGGYLKKGGAYPNSIIRLFRKGKGILPEKSVHEQVKIDGKIGNLKGDLLHFADPSFERYLKRAIRYTDETAQELKKTDPGKQPIQVIKYMLVKPLFTFVSIYIRHKGYQDGFRGFIWALFSSFHHFYAFVNYWSGEND